MDYIYNKFNNIITINHAGEMKYVPDIVCINNITLYNL